MLVSSERRKDHLVLHIGQNVTFEHAAQFKEELEKLVDQDTKGLIVDLGAVDYVCSSALGSLIYLFRQVGTDGGGVYVVMPHTKLRRIFDLVHIPRLVTFVSSPEAAFDIIEAGD